jgi:hypothetical protein
MGGKYHQEAQAVLPPSKHMVLDIESRTRNVGKYSPIYREL